MESIVMHPAYFPNIETMVWAAQSKHIILEVCDNYQKQTFRNRCSIAHSNGILMLTIPIRHNKTGIRQKTATVTTEDNFTWRRDHWRSIQTAYRTSPYFEFYEDEIVDLFEKKHDFLLDLNFYAHEVIAECLQLENKLSYTENYVDTLDDGPDYRYLVKAKGEPEYDLKKYTQVFDSKFGYISNLSILDLLFNEGTTALQYLEDHKFLIST